MKRTLLFGLVAIAISLTTVSVVYAHSEDSYSNSNANPLEVANGYFTAFKNDNADEMIKYSVDTSYQNDASRRKAYEAQGETIQNYIVTDFKQINDSEAIIKVRYVFHDLGTMPEIPFKINKFNSGWKVVVEPIVINHIQGDPDFGKVSKGVPDYLIPHNA
ncbi:hypothetical protein [Cohnella zeiphila]|uniref:DUF4878 domain-containing protein n=1 Tax=Cohnella zeiphila TaxID=2761120 RepID=A0A7X0SRL6_9BACL|nr:hypothetical protein [Cohnella zeiphila]MBB6734681.1 hypothetical protein [Cohnella zeiphila]